MFVLNDWHFGHLFGTYHPTSQFGTCFTSLSPRFRKYLYVGKSCGESYGSGLRIETLNGEILDFLSWESKVPPPKLPRYTPQEIAGLIKELLTIGFP